MSRLRSAFQVLLHSDDSPHRLALSFGIGMWIAFFPIWGIHTLLALALAFAFRLSRAAILVGAYVNNPWTLVPMYMTGTAVGCWLLGVPIAGIYELDWNLHGRAVYQVLLDSLRPYLWPFLLGNTVLGIAAGLFGYVLLREVLERRSRAAAASA
jgi:uncharacterized protein (DUF2062 family)